MPRSEDYRAKAAEILARAKYETNVSLRIELTRLAESYLRLAEQADRNTPSSPDQGTPQQHQPEQQQQSKLKPDVDSE
jgi:hypothetical protein